MPQLNLYIPDDLAELVRREVETEWPIDYFETVIGGWVCEPLQRAPQGVAETRESFAPGD